MGLFARTALLGALNAALGGRLPLFKVLLVVPLPLPPPAPPPPPQPNRQVVHKSALRIFVGDMPVPQAVGNLKFGIG